MSADTSTRPDWSELLPAIASARQIAGANPELVAVAATNAQLVVGEVPSVDFGDEAQLHAFAMGVVLAAKLGDRATVMFSLFSLVPDDVGGTS